MSRFKNAAIMGTGSMGPGMGAVLARAGMSVRMYDTSADAIEAAKAMHGLAWGVLEKLETPDQGGGSVSYATDVAEALDGAWTEVLDEDVGGINEAPENVGA